MRVVVSGGAWEVQKQMRVEEMSVPMHWTPEESGHLEHSSYYEVKGVKGSLYRRRISDPTDSSVEIFDRGGIRRAETEHPVTLDILAPEREPIERVRLVVRGRDLPLKEGRKKPHTDGYKVPGARPK